MKKALIIILVFTAMAFNEASAQNYSTAIGFRGGIYNGLTIKHFTSSNKAIEGIINVAPYNRWAAITGLLEFDNEIGSVTGLTWFYGVGAHIGSYDNDPGYRWYNDTRGRRYVGLGLDGILGLDYTFPDVPINLQLDWKPSFDLFGYQYWRGDEIALSIRIAID